MAPMEAWSDIESIVLDVPPIDQACKMPIVFPMLSDITKLTCTVRARDPHASSATTPPLSQDCVNTNSFPTKSFKSTSHVATRIQATPKAAVQPVDIGELGSGPCILGDLRVFDEVCSPGGAPAHAVSRRPKRKATQDPGPSTNELEKAIKDVSLHVCNVRTSFRDVQDALLDVGFPVEVLNSLNIEWTVIATQFNEVLKHSGESAANGYEAVSQFLSLVLPCLRDSRLPVGAKLGLLTKYKETIVEGHAFADRIWSAHQEMQNKIASFQCACSARTSDLVRELRAKVSRAETHVFGLSSCFQRVVHGFSRIFTRGALKGVLTGHVEGAPNQPPSTQEYNRKSKKAIYRAGQAIQEVDALRTVWELFVQEIRGLETSLSIIQIVAISDCPEWTSKELLEESLSTLPGRYATLKRCLQLYAKAVSEN